MIVLIDNGHGRETKDKRSPDGNFLEYKWTREEAKLLQAYLTQLGVKSFLIVPEVTDIALSTRCARVNDYCRQLGATNVLLISLHCDAQPGCDAKWGDARGLTSIVYNKAGHLSREVAALITDAANDAHLLGNRSVPSCLYREQNLAVLRDTLCPAVLVECGFMTNQLDVELMKSTEGRVKIAHAIASAVHKYVNNYV